MARRKEDKGKKKEKPRTAPVPSSTTATVTPISLSKLGTPSPYSFSSPFSEQELIISSSNTPADDVLKQIDSIHAPIKNQMIRFETFLFIYLIVHLLMQNYNIYQIVRFSN